MVSHSLRAALLGNQVDFLLHITCTSSDELEAVHREIKSIEGVSGTHTHFVLKTVKAGQYPLKSKAMDA